MSSTASVARGPNLEVGDDRTAIVVAFRARFVAAGR